MWAVCAHARGRGSSPEYHDHEMIMKVDVDDRKSSDHDGLVVTSVAMPAVGCCVAIDTPVVVWAVVDIDWAGVPLALNYQNQKKEKEEITISNQVILSYLSPILHFLHPFRSSTSHHCYTDASSMSRPNLITNLIGTTQSKSKSRDPQTKKRERKDGYHQRKKK